MELLDAAIALVITLAALATTVTVFMEIWVRFFGLKSQTQVKLFQKIFDNAVKDKMPGQLDRWEFVKKVLKNPLLGGEMREPKPGNMAPYVGVRSKGIYEWVSDEHVYRRLLGMPGALNASKEELVSKLKQFSRKYDEFCAAASVEFKENRRRWSIIIGVLFAVAFNVDGVRIFNEYVKRPELAAAMAAKAEELERTAQRAEERLQAAIDNLDREETSGKSKSEEPTEKAKSEEATNNSTEDGIKEIENRVAELKGSIAELETAGIPIGWRYAPHCLLLETLKPVDGKDGSNGKKDSGSIAGNGDNRAGGGAASNPGDSDAGDRGAPSSGTDPGSNAREDTVAATNPAHACRLAEDRQGGWQVWLGSIIAMLGTGILIGLGAPFWFDVARRLAEVRSFFGGKGGGEAAYTGETAGTAQEGKTKSQKTDELINRVVDEALAENLVTGARRLLVKGSDV